MMDRVDAQIIGGTSDAVCDRIDALELQLAAMKEQLDTIEKYLVRAEMKEQLDTIERYLVRADTTIASIAEQVMPTINELSNSPMLKMFMGKKKS